MIGCKCPQIWRWVLGGFLVCGWVDAGEVVAQDVGGAEAPGTYLAVTTQPQANVPGTPLARQPVVEVRYADGTRFADYYGPVTA